MVLLVLFNAQMSLILGPWRPDYIILSSSLVIMSPVLSIRPHPPKHTDSLSRLKQLTLIFTMRLILLTFGVDFTERKIFTFVVMTPQPYSAE